MKLALNFKNGKKRIFTTEESDQIVKGLNYMKVIQFFMGNKEIKGTLNVLGKQIPVSDIHSIEFIL
ncbi:hypothetical protein SAMN02745248_02331 [Hathewaya proteolytica DSM 3090]|uniref:Uncharacterized protein n=1 Tax=Hathewaya proteolytica DSM 3090 TaxID=1121331 RepID=A0A1M6RMP5_9CLOT|nr:hypothetical protein [Hathewaya proteolytica]SHK33743.1 hypothetical protein SAMN02745248_02331 [Hathewaya proteolytica DSM 3090]